MFAGGRVAKDDGWMVAAAVVQRCVLAINFEASLVPLFLDGGCFSFVWPLACVCLVSITDGVAVLLRWVGRCNQPLKSIGWTRSLRAIRWSNQSITKSRFCQDTRPFRLRIWLGRDRCFLIVWLGPTRPSSVVVDVLATFVAGFVSGGQDILGGGGPQGHHAHHQQGSAEVWPVAVVDSVDTVRNAHTAPSPPTNASGASCVRTVLSIGARFFVLFSSLRKCLPFSPPESLPPDLSNHIA